MSEKSNQIEFGAGQNRNPTSEIRNMEKRHPDSFGILRGGKKYYRKVMLWDAKGKPSEWSQNAMWQMGLLNKSEWNKEWYLKWVRGNMIL